MRIFAAALTCLVLQVTAADAWAQSRIVPTDRGLFRFEHKSVDVVSSRFVFWRDEWKWVGLSLRHNAGEAGPTFTNGENREWLSLNGAAPRQAALEASWTFNVDLPPASLGRVYGGISFTFNTRPFSKDGADIWPTLDDDGKGWRLSLGAGEPELSVRFDNAPAKITFERNSPREIRVYFTTKESAAPKQSLMMTAGIDGVASAAFADRPEFEQVDKSTWRKGIVGWDRFPVDLSFLNADHRPAGRHGRVIAQGDRLLFEDGSPARFWGTNITARALFQTTLTTECEPAKRLAALGYNLVRMTHHDSDWVQPNIFGDAKGNTEKLSQDSIAALDRWMACLRQEGIYLWLDLHVGRTVSEADGLENFDEVRKGRNRANIRGFNYVNESALNLMKRFNEQFLSHVNSATGIAYKDDPAILAILITNENDLTHHFGNGLLPDKNVPNHNKIYMEKATNFASHWQLNQNRVWRSWEFGPSKLFLSELEHQFNREMIAHLRGMGSKTLLATTNTWGKMSLAGLFSLTDGDLVDVHAYGLGEALRANANYKSTLIDWIAAGQVEGMPVSVTEWGMDEHPVEDRSTLPPQVAAVAALQGWDAMLHYAYTQVPPNSKTHPRTWQAYDDPAILSLMPAAALMFRQGHVAEARKTYALDFGSRLFDERIDPTTSAAIRTLTEQSKVVVRLPRPKSLPWLKDIQRESKAIVVQDPHRRFIAEEADEIVSDTGEYARNWQEGVFRVDTPRTQMVGGWIGGSKHKLSAVKIETKTPYAAIAVQSLTDDPIARSQSLLISMGAQSVPQGNYYISEPVRSVLTIEAPPGLSLYQLTVTGARKPVPVEYDGTSYRIDTSERPASWWYMLEK